MKELWEIDYRAELNEVLADKNYNIGEFVTGKEGFINFLVDMKRCELEMEASNGRLAGND